MQRLVWFFVGAITLAVVVAAGGLIFTLKAAPIMLGIRDLSDPAALQNAFVLLRH